MNSTIIIILDSIEGNDIFWKRNQHIRRVIQPYYQRTKDFNSRAKSVIDINQNFSTIKQKDKVFKMNLSKDKSMPNVRPLVQNNCNIQKGININLIGHTVKNEIEVKRRVNFNQFQGFKHIYNGSLSQKEDLLHQKYYHNRVEKDWLNRNTLLS